MGYTELHFFCRRHGLFVFNTQLPRFVRPVGYVYEKAFVKGQLIDLAKRMGNLKAKGNEELLNEAVGNQNRSRIGDFMFQIIAQVASRGMEGRRHDAVNGRCRASVVVGEELVQGQLLFVCNAENTGVTAQT